MIGLLNKVLCIVVAKETAKLPEVKVGDQKKNTELEPGSHSIIADWAEWQNFFQTSKFDLRQFCSLLRYKDA